MTPYVVTKKTVFKWQEPFWAAMKATFDAHYKEKYLAAGAPLRPGGIVSAQHASTRSDTS